MQAGGPSQPLCTVPLPLDPSKVLHDTTHTSCSTRASTMKGKKRERPHHTNNISKRDHSVISSENYLSLAKRECLMPVADIVSITDKDGGLPNLSAVDQLIVLMQQESKNAIDTDSQRVALVRVIAATQREDCLQHFVQLGGLTILDDWLSEGRKGKTGDENSKDTDKIINEVTLTILDALEKLPIDLEALKSCSIGKAVKHLKSHRISDVQKRARKLVDTWKKRVDLELEISGNFEANGESVQASGGCQKDTSLVKLEEGIEIQKVLPECNDIAVSNDIIVTSVAGSSTSNSPYSSTTQNSIETRTNVSPQKQDSSGTACPISSCGSTMLCNTTQIDTSKNSVSDRIFSDHIRCEMPCSSVVIYEHTKKETLPGEVVACGRNVRKSEAGEFFETVSHLNPKKGKGDPKFLCNHDGPTDLVSSKSSGTHVGAAPKHEKCSSSNTESQRLLSMEGETSVGIEESSVSRQNGQSWLAIDKGTDIHFSKIHMIEVNGRLAKSPSIYDNNESKTTEILDRDDKKDQCPYEQGSPSRITTTAFASDKGAESTVPISLVQSKLLAGMGFIEVKVMKENFTVGCAQSKELDHLKFQGSDERHPSDLNSSERVKTAREHLSNVTGQSECQHFEVTGLEEGVVQPIHRANEDSSVVSHLEDGHVKQSLLINATNDSIDLKADSLGEHGYEVAEDTKDEMDYSDSLCHDSKVMKADSIQLRAWEDLSMNTADASVKNADPFDEATLMRSEKSPLSNSQEDCKYVMGKADSLTNCRINQQTVANEKPSNFATESCTKDHVICQSTVARIQDVEVNSKISCGTTLLECSSEFTVGSVVSPSNASSQPVTAMTLEKTQQQHDFDLNMGVTGDEMLRDIYSSGTLSTPVAVFAAAKGGFIPPASPLHKKIEIGWRGSAATSAFRPAEPRRMLERLQSIPDMKSSITTAAETAKQFRNVFEFDLNVVDQGPSEDETEMPPQTSAGSQCASISQSQPYQFPSTIARLTPHSAVKVDIADFDLNCVGEEMDREPPVDSFSGTVMQQPIERPQKTLARPTMLDFDLNEGSLEEAVHEQVALPICSTAGCTNIVNTPSVGHSIGAGRSADLFPWHQTCASIPVVTLPGLNMARLEPAFSGAMAPPLFGQRQSSVSSLPPSSAMVYPATTQFFGCTPIPFPGNFTINPLTIAPDSAFTVTALGPGMGMPSQAAGQRVVTPIVRPPFVMNIADLRSANGIYSWGRSDLNVTSGNGPTLINCREIGTQGKEHFVYHGGSGSVEEHAQFIQQAALPMGSIKRKESEYNWEKSRAGFQQPSWH